MLRSRIEIRTEYGRSLVSTEPIKQNDQIVEEIPFAFGPKYNSGIVCLGCYRMLPDFGEDGDSEDRCYKCDWPLCSYCIDATDHQQECEIFSETRMTFAGNVTEDGICNQLDCITPLRVLLAKESQPERWKNEIACMEYHDERRRSNKEIWHADLINIAHYLRGPCKLSERFSENLIMQVVGILEVNAFEARTNEGYPLRCLYPITAILAHNCIPNTMRSIYPSENYKIKLRAMVNLEAGQQLQHSYTYTLDGTSQRQFHLKTGKYFTCKCDRCSDPTELGTNFSTIKCNTCYDGWLLPEKPLENDTSWRCTNCQFYISNSNVQEMISVLQTEMEEIQKMPLNTFRLEKTEDLIKKYTCILHPNHFINFSLYLNLIEMYGRVKGYEMNSLSNEMIEKKAKLCRLALKVLDKFEPGLSRTKATIAYELHVPVVLLAKKAFEANLITEKQLAEQLEDGINLLKNCVSILQHEDENSHEGILCKVAQNALQQLFNSCARLTSS